MWRLRVFNITFRYIQNHRVKSRLIGHGPAAEIEITFEIA